MKPAEATATNEQAVPVRDRLAEILSQMFEVAEQERRDAEDEWLKDLRQVRGDYEPEDLRGLQPGQSKAFARLTRSKIKTTDARMIEVLFPAGDKNWEIASTPEPSISEALRQSIIQELVMEKFEATASDVASLPPEVAQQLAADGQLPDINEWADMLAAGQVPDPLVPTDDEMRAAIKANADERADAMSTEIDDQLTEGRYKKHARKVIHCGNTYGIGWLKGPMGSTKEIAFWSPKEDEGGETRWEAERRTVRLPYFEFVPHWDIYVYRADVACVSDAEGIFQRYRMAKHEVVDLMRRDDFDSEAIRTYLQAYPNGESPKLRHHEQELRNEADEDQGRINPGAENRYEVFEYTGWMNGKDLADAGMDIKEEDQWRPRKVNVWWIGPSLIRSVEFWADDPGVQMYHRYVYEEDEVGIYGVGVPRIFRDPQKIFNASLRASLDNARWAKDPIREVNISLLDPEESHRIDDLDAGDTIHRTGKGQEAQHPAVRLHQVDSRIREFKTLMDLAMQLGDEATAIPRYTGGSGYDTGGATRTASGLSMLMSQSNVVLKEPISNYDDMSRSFMTALYHWNMQFNERDDIKGDYEIHAIGSTSLVAREMYIEQLEQMANGTLNQEDATWNKRGELLRERYRARNLDPDTFVLTDDEHEQMMDRIAERQGNAAAG